MKKLLSRESYGVPDTLNIFIIIADILGAILVLGNGMTLLIPENAPEFLLNIFNCIFMVFFPLDFIAYYLGFVYLPLIIGTIVIYSIVCAVRGNSFKPLTYPLSYFGIITLIVGYVMATKVIPMCF